jgi:ribonuclease R
MPIVRRAPAIDARGILGVMAKTPYPQTDRELIRRIERSAGHRAGYKQLIRELGLGGGRERRLLLEQLARITARGELVKTEFEQWALPGATFEKTARAGRADAMPGEQPGRRCGATRDRLVAGRLDLHRDGYGFVRPNGSTNRDDDLFIPPNELNGAMQGDEVLVDEAAAGAQAATGGGRGGLRGCADAAESDGGGDLSLCAGGARREARGTMCPWCNGELCDAAG